MKLFFILLSFLSLPAFSDVVGTWAYSGSGCIDDSLDFNTFVSEAPPYDETIVEAIFKFNRNGTASMEALHDNGRTQTESGNYTLAGNDIIIDTWPEANLTLEGNRIFITDSENDSDYSEICRRGDIFVYLLAPVDS